jgi:hypothetical protein
MPGHSKDVYREDLFSPLPNELLKLILNKLLPDDLAKMAHVSHRFRFLIDQDSYRGAVDNLLVEPENVIAEKLEGYSRKFNANTPPALIQLLLNRLVEEVQRNLSDNQEAFNEICANNLAIFAEASNDIGLHREVLSQVGNIGYEWMSTRSFSLGHTLFMCTNRDFVLCALILHSTPEFHREILAKATELQIRSCPLSLLLMSSDERTREIILSHIIPSYHISSILDVSHREHLLEGSIEHCESRELLNMIKATVHSTTLNLSQQTVDILDNQIKQREEKRDIHIDSIDLASKVYQLRRSIRTCTSLRELNKIETAIGKLSLSKEPLGNLYKLLAKQSVHIGKTKASNASKSAIAALSKGMRSLTTSVRGKNALSR